MTMDLLLKDGTSLAKEDVMERLREVCGEGNLNNIFENYLRQNKEYIVLSKIVDMISEDFIDMLEDTEKSLFLKLVEEKDELTRVINKCFFSFISDVTT